MASRERIHAFVLGHSIGVRYGTVFKGKRPIYVEYAFTLEEQAEARPLMLLALVQDKLYDLQNDAEFFERVRSPRLVERLLGTLEDRLLARLAFRRT